MRVLFLAFLALAGCSVSGGGGGLAGQVSSASLSAAEALENQVKSQNISDPGSLPTSGNARYDGFMTARLPVLEGGARRAYVGDLRLDVDFAAKRNGLSGRANGFVANNEKLGGGLTISGGDVFRGTDPDDNYTFSGLVDGRLTRGGDRYAIDAEIEGEFRGRNQTGVNGVLFGDIEGPAGQDIFDGSFAAERR